MNIDEIDVFHYQPECHVAGCLAPATYKVAAIWSNGTSRELKNYGLTCEAHREALLKRAQISREGLRLAEGESVGSVGLYRLDPGLRDADLRPIEGQGSSPTR